MANDAREDSAVLEVAGQPVSLGGEPAWTDGRLARRDVTVSETRWSAARRRAAETPEDCLAIADASGDPIPLAAVASLGRRWSLAD